MNRRQLLKYLAGGVVSVATGEVLVPAARTYFLPPRGGWPRSLYFVDELPFIPVHTNTGEVDWAQWPGYTTLVRAEYDLRAADPRRLDRHGLIITG